MIHIKDIKLKYGILKLDSKTYSLYDKENEGIYQVKPFLTNIIKDKHGYYHVKGFESTNNFSTLEEQINQAVDNYEYPSEFYDPKLKKGYFEMFAIQYELEKLGYTRLEEIFEYKSDNQIFKTFPSIFIGNLSPFSNNDYSIYLLTGNESEYLEISNNIVDYKDVIKQVKELLHTYCLMNMFEYYNVMGKTVDGGLSEIEDIFSTVPNLFKPNETISIKKLLIDNLRNKLDKLLSRE